MCDAIEINIIIIYYKGRNFTLWKSMLPYVIKCINAAELMNANSAASSIAGGSVRLADGDTAIKVELKCITSIESQFFLVEKYTN